MRAYNFHLVIRKAQRVCTQQAMLSIKAASPAPAPSEYKQTRCQILTVYIQNIYVRDSVFWVGVDGQEVPENGKQRCFLQV